MISWQTLNTVDATNAQTDTKIRAVAGQFQWKFDYMPSDLRPRKARRSTARRRSYIEYAPTGDGRRPAVPTGRTVQLYLTSPDVIHAFYVPQFLFKRDVVPGRVNQFDFNVERRPGRPDLPRPVRRAVRDRATGIMLFDVHALTGADFDAWLAAKAAATPSQAPPSAAPSGDGVPSGAPGAATELTVVAKNIAFDDADARGARPTARSRSSSTTRTPATPHNIKIFKDSIGGEVVFDGQDLPGRRHGDLPGRAAGRAARTRSSASSTRT